eukprot:CFRG0381T1
MAEAVGSKHQQYLFDLGEYFDSQKQYLQAVHCFEAGLLVPCAPRVEMCARLRVGKLYAFHAWNAGPRARTSLERAMFLSSSISGIEEQKLDVLLMLCEVLVRVGEANQANSRLRMALGACSPDDLSAFFRISFLLARVMGESGDTQGALDVIRNAKMSATSSGHVETELLLGLSEVHLGLIVGDLVVVEGQLRDVGARVLICEQYMTNEGMIRPAWIELVTSHYYILKVTYILQSASFDEAAKTLSKLQASIKRLQAIGLSTMNHSFHCAWLEPPLLLALGYVVSVALEVAMGKMDKCIKHGQSALAFLQAFKVAIPTHTGKEPLLDADRRTNETIRACLFIVLESMTSACIIQRDLVQAQRNLLLLTGLCDYRSERMAILHVLVAQYLYVCGAGEEALSHVHRASMYDIDDELRALIAMQEVALSTSSYLKHTSKQGFDVESGVAFTAVATKRLAALPHINLRRRSRVHEAIESLINGYVASVVVTQLQDARNYYTQCLRISQQHKLQRLTVQAMVRLSAISETLGEPPKRIRDVVNPAQAVAKKMGDVEILVEAGKCLVASQRRSLSENDQDGGVSSPSYGEVVSEMRSKTESAIVSAIQNSDAHRWLLSWDLR